MRAIRSNFFPKATLLDSTNFCYSFTLAQQLKLHQIAKHQISGMSLEAREEKASLKAWWASFTKGKDKDGKKDERRGVFGLPLRVSLKYASVAISMAGEDGNQYVWGYIPVVVAKVGLYLKENATDVEGIFRIAGSQKRMKELQEVFETPPRYGKNVDWSKYSVHDAASVLRRYLNHMPEPIIPLHLYSEFRNVMVKEPFDVEAAIKTYRLLITSSPPANQYLLLYVLDLLAVFSRESEKNLMPASNLALIFQPGIFSNPTHLTSSNEHKIAVEVLEFLIEHQDHFVLGLGATAPSTFNLEQLTAVSRPLTDEDVLEASDSDEDLGEMEVHEGGGARLGRSSTSKPTPTKQKRLFSGASRKSNKAADDSQLAASYDDSTPKFQRDAHTPEPTPVTASEDAPLGQGSAKVRRSKTTPSRKSGTGKEESAPNSGKSSKRNSRRKSSEAGSPIASPRESTIQLGPLSTVSNNQVSTEPQVTQATEKAIASSHNSSNPEDDTAATSKTETALPTPPASKLLSPTENSETLEKPADEQPSSTAEVKPA